MLRRVSRRAALAPQSRPTFSTTRRAHPHHTVKTAAATATAAAFSPTRPLRYRNVVENTLADTDSGYIQDPRSHPAAMVAYRKLTAASSAALETLAEEEELMAREDLAYGGYTTPGIQHAKRTVFDRNADDAALAAAVAALEGELVGVCELMGREAARQPMSAAERHLRRERRRQLEEERAAADDAFRVPAPPPPAFTVAVGEDGAEELLLRRRPTRVRTTDRPAAVEEEEEEEAGAAAASVEVGDAALYDESDFPPPEIVTVCAADADHVRYVLGLGYRRLGRLAEAESVLMAMLHNDVRSVDAVESLLELHTGTKDLGKVRQLLDFLEEEFERAGAEGRLANAEGRGRAAATGGGGGGGGDRGEGESPAGDELPPAETVLPDGSVVMAAGTAPTATPAEIALSVLAGMIVEGATRHCAAHGEGATSRYFLDCLRPLGGALRSDQLTMLLEALFRVVDEQHYVARFELDEAGAQKDDRLIYTVVVSFLKMLLATGMDAMVQEPVQFRFFILSKLHSALRSSGRRAESYRFCEDMLTLYRSNSSVYAERRQRQKEQQQDEQKGQKSGGAVAGEGTASTSASPSSSSSSPPRMTLDDLDDSYRSSLFQYVNDRAIDSAAVGRELCLAAMDEFPDAAAPWETLALILHREDPKRNLSDAILAARCGLSKEPFNLSLILTCANFYKAARKYALHDLMLDRYRLLCYMLENNASEEDLHGVADEILAIEGHAAESDAAVRAEERHFRAQQLHEMPELLRAVRQWDNIHEATRTPHVVTHQQPVTNPSQELGISEDRPGEMAVDFRDSSDAMGRRAGGI